MTSPHVASTEACSLARSPGMLLFPANSLIKNLIKQIPRQEIKWRKGVIATGTAQEEQTWCEDASVKEATAR